MNDSDLNIGERRRGSSQNSDDDRQGRERERERLNREDRPSRFSERTPSPRAAVDRDRDRDHGNSSARPSERRVFVSNIPYEYRWQDLKDLFRTHVGEVSYVELFYDEAEKPRGCGIVEFDSINLVNKAVEKMHRFNLNSRKLVVKEVITELCSYDFGTARDKCGRLIKPGGGGGGGDHMRGGPHKDMMGLRGGGGGGGGRQWDNPQGGMNPGQPQKWGDTYGLSPQFLESLWISPPLVCRVFVANLDYKVDSNKLKEVFKLAGKVQSAEVSLDKEGKSRGFGVVEFDHPVEAVQAISMLHNQMLFDRRMTVRMDRAENKLEGPPKLPEGLRGVGMGLGSGGNPLRDVSKYVFVRREPAKLDPGTRSGTRTDAPTDTQPSNRARTRRNVASGPCALVAGGLGNATGLANAGLAGLGGLNAASIIGSQHKRGGPSRSSQRRGSE
uniref:RRM domain-containing protein n=1 Tax=Timema genevievae TaxID=629358 RepID=A0A7R9K268_TIMGE|nr:unnamed protein product [Timema genevievae]